MREDNVYRSQAARWVESFRRPGQRSPLHPQEKGLLIVLCIHLCFLPWALGTMHVWSQLVSLFLGFVGFRIALRPRVYGRELGGGEEPFRLTMWPKLARFPIFWIGLALLVYILVQAFNPWWGFVQNAKYWWLVRMTDIPWLPAGIEAPFKQFDAWRQMIIYAGVLLPVCSVWVGMTRRRSLRILLTVIAVNAFALGAVVAFQHVTGTVRAIWPLGELTDEPVTGSFIYENHTGAYLALAAFSAIGLATWYADHGRRALSKSTPTGVLALGALFLGASVLLTLSRGAGVSLGVGLLIFAAWYLVRRKVRPMPSAANPRVTTLVVLVFIVFALSTFWHLDFSAVYNRFDAMATEGSHEASVHSRILAREAAWEMLGDHWVRGVGAGGFQYLFPEYVKRYPEIYDHGNLFWEHAHCDWLEIPIELGLVGDLLILAAAGWWAAGSLRRGTLWNPIVVPLLIGCLQTLIHAGFDFPFQCPAILATWCILVAIAGRWAEIEGGEEVGI